MRQKRLRGRNAVVDLTGGTTLYRCVITDPLKPLLRNRLARHTYLWLVDLDQLPGTPRRPAPFRRPGFLGTEPEIRANLEVYLATQGVDLRGGRVKMLAAARVLGRVPSSPCVYWCHDRSGALVCVVAEVADPDGSRRRHLIRPGAHNAVETVGNDCPASVFVSVPGGHRTMGLPGPGERLDLTITLPRPGRPPFVTEVRGRRRPAPGFPVLFPVTPILVLARMRGGGLPA